MSKLYLIDGMSLVFRAYHGMSKSNLTNSNGELTGAIFAFANIVTSLLEKNKPEKIAVVFDTPHPTFRHDMYVEYKANRAEFPEDLIPQLGKIKEFISLLGITQIELPGYEADDIIATIAKHASSHKVLTFCITSDKDYYQLVDDYIKILKPSRTGPDLELVDFDEVKEKFGVRPDQVIDVQALIGDSVDNIPGVKGIGEKSAIPMIQEYGTLENLYQNLNKIDKKAVKAKLEENKEMAFLSKVLVTLKLDVPIDETHIDCILKTPNYTELDNFLNEAGFKTLRQKWHAKSGKPIPKDIIEAFESIGNEEVDNIKSKKRDYNLVDNETKFELMMKEISGTKLLSFDLETSSLDRNSCVIVGIALSIKENSAYYIATSEVNSQNQDEGQNSLFDSPKEIVKQEISYPSLPIDYVVNKLRLLLTSQSVGKIGQNCKFDTYILRRFGVEVSPIVFDSMLASYILNPDDKHNMDALSLKWLNYKTVSITSLIGEKKKDQKSMKDLAPSDISDYACEDADIALKLMNVLGPSLGKTGQTELATQIEFPIVEVLTKMESNGVAINVIALSEMAIKIQYSMNELQKNIFEEADYEFNLDSPKQLGFVLFEKLKLPIIKQTKSGYSTDVDVLTELAPSYKIAEYMLEYRSLTKLKSTYVDALPKLINPFTGRLHTTYNQTIASTGRLSSVEPNLQNIPIRTKLGKEIRKAFVPQANDALILSADYSQVELRIMAHICKDESLIVAFEKGQDIHAATAATLYGIQLDQVNSDMRRVAKTVNFGIMYGLGTFGLAQRLGISRTEAKNIITNYFEKYPGIRGYIDNTILEAQEKGYTETLCGRRRYFPDLKNNNRTIRQQAERAAINMPIQGTASDMMKIAMINIDKEMTKAGLKSLMMLQVHDELVFEAKIDEIELLEKLVKVQMEKALPLGRVPVIVDTGKGLNWFEAH
jgi:DNA polymerase-1